MQEVARTKWNVAGSELAEAQTGEGRAGDWSDRKVQELMFSRPETADRMMPCAVMISSLLYVCVHPECIDGKVNETVCKYVVILVAPFP